MRSQRFESRDREHPLTGFLSPQPVKVRLSPQVSGKAIPLALHPFGLKAGGKSSGCGRLTRPVRSRFLRLCLSLPDCGQIEPRHASLALLSLSRPFAPFILIVLRAR